MNGYYSNNNPSYPSTTNGQPLEIETLCPVCTLPADFPMDKNTPFSTTLTNEDTSVFLFHNIPNMGQDTFFHFSPLRLLNIVMIIVHNPPCFDSHPPSHADNIKGEDEDKKHLNISTDTHHFCHLIQD
jgi:hypothetical protein